MKRVPLQSKERERLYDVSVRRINNKALMKEDENEQIRFRINGWRSGTDFYGGRDRILNVFFWKAYLISFSAVMAALVDGSMIGTDLPWHRVEASPEASTGISGFFAASDAGMALCGRCAVFYIEI